MKTVKEISILTGLTPRTLQYYDKIGLLTPSAYTESGYRLYDDENLKKLHQIMFFRELEFPLKDIIRILNSENYDVKEALIQQIELLTLKKKHLEKLILNAAEILNSKGENNMNFDVFDKSELDDYERRAKEYWGDTKEYKESKIKQSKRTKEENDKVNRNFGLIFKEFGDLKKEGPADERVQNLVVKLQNYITHNYYTCSKEILKSLGIMYETEEFKKNIDNIGGEGTASFTSEAIKIYTQK